MYKLSILAMFKNEEKIIKEWIDHYLKEGIQHFYLIDNGSNDNYKNILNKYMNKITLIKDPTRLEKNTQSYLYNKHFLDKIKKETEWIIVCDIDEYFYLNDKTKLIEYFNKKIEHDILWVPWRLFGTTFKNTPDSLIKSLLLRKKDEIKNSFGHGKSIIKTKKLLKLNVHLSDMEKNIPIKKIDFNDKLRLNHYKLISEDYYKNNKCVRGGGESGLVITYTMDSFKKQNQNFLEIKDDILSKKY